MRTFFRSLGLFGVAALSLTACLRRCPVPNCKVKMKHVHRFVIPEEPAADTAAIDSSRLLYMPEVAAPKETLPPPKEGKKKEYRAVSVTKISGDLPDPEPEFVEKDEFQPDSTKLRGISLRRPSVPLEGKRVPWLVRGRPWWKKQNVQVGELYRKPKRGPNKKDEGEGGFLSFLKKKKE